MERTQAPYALLVKRQTFTPYKMKANTELDQIDAGRMSREKAIQVVIEAINDKSVVVGTTGMLSR